jgi:two-component system, OmpR family, phosphate regulon sensor histidine kinase PhoR
MRFRRGITPTRLRLLLGAMLLGLALPSALLYWQTQRQLKLEAWHQQRELAENLAARIDGDLARLVATEEARGYADYRFLTVAGEVTQALMPQRSPLAALPRESGLPGLLGHFQIDPDGQFSTPLLPMLPGMPASWGVGEDEWRERQRIQARLLEVLQNNQLIARESPEPQRLAGSRAPAREEAMEDAVEVAPSQAAFDRLATQESSRQRTLSGRPAGKEAEPGEKPMAEMVAEAPAPRVMRREQAAVLDMAESDTETGFVDVVGEPGISLFESDLSPFEFSRLDSGHFVLFRRVWTDDGRSIQGLLIEPEPFVTDTIIRPFLDSALANTASILLHWRGQLIQHLPGDSSHVDSLYQRQLSAPLGDLELRVDFGELSPGPGARMANWTAMVLLGVLLLGFLALYRLGLGQIRLARQQQDFVAAVSHELKTPLTSIRMYGELLREGWVPDDKRREYYAYIHDESERLSRLIGNVLQLARMERQELDLDCRKTSLNQVFDLLQSRLSAQIERAGFTAAFELDPAMAEREVSIDHDTLLQILINLVDNALKFSARSEHRQVDIRVRADGADHVLLSVRDHGPGVPRAQMRRIFDLFYRPGNGITRDTAGTGIGLALVRELTIAMGGTVEVVNREPGAEFRVRLPLA